MRRPTFLSALALAACASAPLPHVAKAPPPTPPAPPPSSPPALAPTPTETSPEASAPIDPRAARLLGLCRLWGEVRYLHPWVVAGSVDWDAALVSALPRALAAQTDADMAAAASALIEALHDPATQVVPPAAESTAAPEPPEAPAASETVDGVTVVRVNVSGWSDMEAAGHRAVAEVAKAKLAVLDLRAPKGKAWMTAMALEQVASELTWHEGTGAVERIAEHRGYRPQSGVTSGNYGTLFASFLPTGYAATKGPHPTRIVFLTNDAGSLPAVAWAMQRAGDAVVVAQGAPSSSHGSGSTDEVELSGGYVARVRVSQATGPLPRPDLLLDAAMPSAKVERAAIAAAKHPPARAMARVEQAPAAGRPLAWRPDATYGDEPYPSRERRVLALFRFWSVIHYFYPYLPLMRDSWDHDVAEFLPRFESAADAREYALTVAELAARIPDGHVGVWGSSELRKARGEWFAPFEVRIVQGEVVVTGVPNEAALGASKLAIGDVILAIDGEPISNRMARASRYISASNDVTRSAWAAEHAFRGDPELKLALTVRGKQGETRDVVVARSKEWPSVTRTGPVFRLLEGGIGYADLDRLEPKDVDAMFAAFEKSPAIVFDMRGYPHGTAWPIAPRLNVRKAKFAAQFFEPFVSPGSNTLGFFEQPISETDKPLYRGKTVMLIDERTMSQAEHTGLFFEAANGTTFIGSQTAGANGDVTNLSLPGGLYVSFSGHDVRHFDGRQLQRVGLVPAIEVKPTIDGLRAGRDEVLERAVTFLRTGK